MGQGAAMAFLITGAGTSVGAITGGLLIARWACSWSVCCGSVGAVAFGLLSNVLL